MDHLEIAVLPLLLMMVAKPNAQSTIRDCAEACPSIAFVRSTSANVKSFYMTTHEITWAEYLQAVKEAGCAVPVNDFKRTLIDLSQRNLADDYPITGVSIYDFRCFITWVNKKTGRRYRLPTSLEWLEAARDLPAKTKEPGKTRDRQFWDTRFAVKSLFVHPVGTSAPTAEGIYDLEGNAAEYTSDRRTTKNLGECHKAGFADCYDAGVIGWNWLKHTATGFDLDEYKKLQWHPETIPDFAIGFRLVRDE